MKNTIKMVTALSICVASFLTAGEWTRDLTAEIPQLGESAAHKNFKYIADVAQYKQADWSNAIGIAKGISLSEAFKIANENPDISYFFYTKGIQMVSENKDGSYRLFRHGDTVFFAGEPSWGTAPGLADGYIRVQN
jgi:hypothetical protein